MHCFRGKFLWVILNNNLTLCFKFLDENRSEAVYLSYSWNVTFLTWRGRWGTRSAEGPPSSAMTSFSFAPSLSSWSHMELMPYVINLTGSAVNKWYNIADEWTLMWLKSKTVTSVLLWNSSSIKSIQELKPYELATASVALLVYLCDKI